MLNMGFSSVQPQIVTIENVYDYKNKSINWKMKYIKLKIIINQKLMNNNRKNIIKKTIAGALNSWFLNIFLCTVTTADK